MVKIISKMVIDTLYSTYLKMSLARKLNIIPGRMEAVRRVSAHDIIAPPIVGPTALARDIVVNEMPLAAPLCSCSTALFCSMNKDVTMRREKAFFSTDAIFKSSQSATPDKLAI